MAFDRFDQLFVFSPCRVICFRNDQENSFMWQQQVPFGSSVDFQLAGRPMKFPCGSREGDLACRHGDCTGRAINHSVSDQVLASFNFGAVQQRGINKRRAPQRHNHRRDKRINAVGLNCDENQGAQRNEGQ